MVRTKGSRKDQFGEDKGSTHLCSNLVKEGDKPDPKHAGFVPSSCSTRIPAPLRESRGLTLLRANYSQLLQEFADWSAQNPACRVHRVSGSDQAITPETSAANIDCRQQVKPLLNKPIIGEESKANPSNIQACKPDQHCHVSCTSSPASTHCSRKQAPRTAASPAKSPSSKRKSRPRPAWRSSIIIISTTQHEDQQPTSAVQGDSCSAADSQQCLQTSGVAGDSTPLAEHLFGLQSLGQDTGKKPTTPDSILDQQPELHTSLQAAATGNTDPQLQQKRQSSAAKELSSGEASVKHGQKVGRPGGSKSADSARHATQQQQQLEQRAKPGRKRVHKHNPAAAPEALAVDLCDVGVGQMFIVPMLQLPHAPPAATPAAQCSTDGATGQQSVSRSAPTSARSGDVANPAATWRGTSQPRLAQLSSQGSHPLTGRSSSRSIPELLPAGITYRRHSATDAEQDSSETALWSANRQAGASESSSQEPLQHIKQLQAIRRRSLGSLQDVAYLRVDGNRAAAVCKQPTASGLPATAVTAGAAGSELPIAGKATCTLPPLAPAAATHNSHSSKLPQPVAPPTSTTSNARGASAPTTSRSDNEPPLVAQCSNSTGYRCKAGAHSLTGVSRSNRCAVLPALRPSLSGDRHNTSSRAPQVSAACSEGCVQGTASSCQLLLSPVAPAAGSNTQSNSSGDQQPTTTCSTYTKPQEIVAQSRSIKVPKSSAQTSSYKGSNSVQITQSTRTCSSSAAVSSENGSSSCTSKKTHKQACETTESADEQTSSNISSLSSSFVDADGVAAAAESAASSLAYEPSSFGVCGENPAGAVHFVRPALSDKLARLRPKVSSKHNVIDDDGLPAPPGGSAAEEKAATAARTVCENAPAYSVNACAAADGGLSSMLGFGHHSINSRGMSAEKVVGPIWGEGCQQTVHDSPGHTGTRHETKPDHPVVQLDQPLLECQQQQQQAPTSAERIRARWQIPMQSPDALSQQPQQIACNFKQQESSSTMRLVDQQQSLPAVEQQQHHQVPVQPPQGSAITEHTYQQPRVPQLPPLQQSVPWQQRVIAGQQQLYGTHPQQQQQQTPQHVSSSMWFPAQAQAPGSRWPSHMAEQHLGAATQYPRVDSSSFPYQTSAAPPWQHQQQHSYWLPGYPAAGYDRRQQHWQMHWNPQQVQEQVQQQSAFPYASWIPWQQQQQQQQQPQPAAPGSVAVPPGPLPPLGHVPTQGRMQQPLATIPSSGGPAPPLSSHDQQAQAGSATLRIAAHELKPSTDAAFSSQELGQKRLARADSGLAAWVSSAEVHSRFTGPWAKQQPQQQQTACTIQETSAAAMARQRQEAQKQLFQGLSLEAVLKSAKKATLQPCFGRVCT